MAVGHKCFSRRCVAQCVAGWALPALPAGAAGAGMPTGPGAKRCRCAQPPGVAGGDGATGGGSGDTHALCQLLQRLGLPHALRALELAGCAPCARAPCPAGLPSACRRRNGQRALSASAHALAPRLQALAARFTVRTPGAHCTSAL